MKTDIEEYPEVTISVDTVRARSNEMDEVRLIISTYRFSTNVPYKIRYVMRFLGGRALRISSRRSCQLTEYVPDNEF